MNPRPGKPHLRTASRLGTYLGGPFDFGTHGPGGWHLLDEPEFHLDTDPDFPVVLPDLAGWRHGTLPSLDDDEAAFSVRPDWVCEILSPRTAAHDRADKMPFYARAGVSHAWLIDPVLRTLEVYSNESGRWVVVHVWQGDVNVRAVPFDAVELPLSVLWFPVRSATDPR